VLPERVYKTPISVLVVIHTPTLLVLLLERADHPGYWQSVTGSLDADELHARAAQREVFEETRIDASRHVLTDWNLQYEFEIFEEWRHRYEPGVTRNTEHVFGLCVSRADTVTVHAREHLGFIWLPWQEAAEKVFSWTNKAAILKLPEKFAG